MFLIAAMNVVLFGGGEAVERNLVSNRQKKAQLNTGQKKHKGETSQK